MSDAAVKKRLQRARRSLREHLEIERYRVTIYHGVLTATKKDEVRRIIVYLDRRNMPKADQLPPGYERCLKTGRAKFEYQ